MIKNIVFDLGGVLIDLDRQRCIKSFAEIGFDCVPYIGQYEQKGIFRQLETGEISERQFLDGIKCEATDEQKTRAWTDFLVCLPENRKQTILDLRSRGYRTYLLSNTNSIDWKFAVDNFFNINGKSINDYFDEIFLSFEFHVLKPDPEIFRLSLTKANLKAEETIFIDDSQNNCQAAESVGLHTLCALGDEWTSKLAQIL